jgi:hypothetical protein
MGLSVAVRKIQYQAAKLEVIESLLKLGKTTHPSLEAEITHNSFVIIQKNLYDTCEQCFQTSSFRELERLRGVLLDMVYSTNNILIPWANQLSSADPYTLLIKELVLDIAAQLIAASSDLDPRQPELLNIPIKFNDPDPELELIP